MIKWSMPGNEQLLELAAQWKIEPLTYAHPQATRGEFPVGYRQGGARMPLGSGEQTFEQARDLLFDFQQFDVGWVKLFHRQPVHENQIVVVLARVLGVATVNPCRVVYVEETEDSKGKRASYACGTLPGHDFAGEERFLVEWNRNSDVVEMDISSFSKPSSFAAKAVAPLVRRFQHQFRSDAIGRLKRLIEQR